MPFTCSLSLVCISDAMLRRKTDNQYTNSALVGIRQHHRADRQHHHRADIKNHRADSASTSLTALSAIPSCDRFFAADDTACKISYTINRQAK